MDTLRALEKLMSRLASCDFPITLYQLLRFCKNPEVIIPSNTLEVRVLDRKYEILDCICDGEHVAFYALTNDHHVFVSGDVEQLMRPRSRDMFFQSMRFLGIKDHKPVWIYKHTYVRGDDNEMVYDSPEEEWEEKRCDRWELNFGTEVVLTGVNYACSLMLRDGSVIIAENDDALNTYKVTKWKDGAVTPVVRNDPRFMYQFLEHPNGDVYVLWYEANNSRFGTLLEGVDRDETPLSLRSIYLPDGRYAMKKQHHQEQWCWVIDGNAGPVFPWVSDIFKHTKHGLCYFARIDHFILLMKVPS